MKRTRRLVVLGLAVVGIAVAALAVCSVYSRYVKGGHRNPALEKLGGLITEAKQWAMAHPNPDGTPCWPSSPADVPSIDVRPIRDWTFTFDGDSGDATDSSVKFTVRAMGKPNGKARGVEVKVTVPGINANGLPPVITGL